MRGIKRDLKKISDSLEDRLGFSLGGELAVGVYISVFLIWNLIGASFLSPTGWATYQVSNTNPPAGAMWIEGCSLHWADGSYEYYFDCPTETTVVDSNSPGPNGAVWIEGNTIHWIDQNGDERRYSQYQDTGANPSGASPGAVWVDGYLHFIDTDGDEISTNELPGSDQ